MPDHKTQTKGVFRFVQLSIIGQILSTFLGMLGIFVSFNIVWPWWPGILGIASAFIVAFLIVICGFYLHRAFYLYICNSLISFCWAIPLLGAGFKIAASSPMQIGITLFFCGLSGALYYLYITKKLVNVRNVRTLATNQILWKLGESPIKKEENARYVFLARILIPLGSVLGVVLYRTTPDYNPMPAASFVLACISMAAMGNNLAIALFIKRQERRLGKIIGV